MVLVQTSATFIVLISVVGQGYASDDTITDQGEDATDNTFLGLWPFEIYNNASGLNDETGYHNESEWYGDDIKLTNQQSVLSQLKKALMHENATWTEGNDGFPRVPYLFLDDVNKTDVRAGISHWIEHTCIKFHETENKSQSHIQFHIGRGCWSMLGMLPDHGQKISIGPGCNSLGIVAHEIGHAMGFYHEQSRRDRDDYVHIMYDNIQPGKEHNFRKADDDNNFGVTYDYTSLMHYSGFGFSKSIYNTIVTKDPLAQELIGHQGGLSHRDILTANRMYKCIDKWIDKCNLTSDPCLQDGYTGKNCECICPPGTSGSNCETGIPDYYADKRNPLSERITSEKTIAMRKNNTGNFVKWITPPPCKRAVLKFTYSNMFKDCYSQFFFLRTDPNDLSGRRMCYSNVYANRKFKSDWQIIITMYNRVTYSSEALIWEAKVTFETISGCTTSNTTTPHPTTEMTSPEPTTSHPPTEITSPEPTTSPGTCPICPTTTCPITPATCPTTTVSTKCPTTCPPVPTTQPPPKSKRIQCTPKGEDHTIRIRKGHAVTLVSPRYPKRYPSDKFTCGWKLKARGRKGRLTVTCEYFRVHHRDRLEIEGNKGVFRSDQRPYFDINQLVILFKSKKESRGRGFRCTVVSE